jgi:hypothetical protein
MKLKDRRSDILPIACLLLINALALVPLLSTGFIADDILNSQIRGHMIQTDRTLWGVTYYYAMLWLRTQGRLFPLAFYGYSVFYLLGNVLLYKFVVLGVILASIAAFFVFLRRLTRSDLIPAIAVLLLPLMFQFRAMWDPVLAFCAAYPLVTLLLFCSLNLFLRAVDEGDRRALWLAVFLFLWDGLIFEVTYPMFLVYGGVAYLRLKNVKTAARASWPFLAVTLCLALASIILRTRATALIGTYQMHLDVGTVIKTYCVQLLGAVPFSYFFFDPHAVFANRIGKWPAALVQVLPLVVLLAAFTVLALRRRLSGDTGSRNTTDRPGILAIGALLLTIPPALISLSPKFQAQTWGDAYLPVYLSYFGLCLLLAVGLEKLYRWGTRLQTGGEWIAPAALCLWLLLLGFNFRNNWLVAQTMNEAVWSPRVLVEEALERGLLTGVSPKAVLLVSGTDLWDNADEYSLKTGIRFSVYPLNEVRDLTPVFQGAGGTCEPGADQQVCYFAADAPVYTVQIRHLTEGTGAVLLARVQRAYQSKGSILGLLSNEVTAYFHLPASAQPLAVAVSGRDMQQKTGASVFRVSRGLQVVKEGRGWKLVSLRGNAVFDALSLRGEITAERTGSAILVAKSRDAFELHASGPELLHAGYEGGDLGNGVEFPAINFENDMCIEVLVVPGDSQGRYAEILSNHWVDSRGLAIEQVNDRTNQYAVAFGTGKGWMEVGAFALAKGRRNYISLQVKDGEARLYLDGNPVARKVLPEPIAASPYPVWIGNWKGGDRPFNGWIEEVLIARGAKSEETVLADAKRLAVAYTSGESRKPLLLKGTEAAFVHRGFDTEGSQSFVLPNTIPLPDTFTLELLVRPASVQGPYATIISNHPGKKGFQGFSLEQIGKTTNYYILAFGNGKSWMPVGDFAISPGDLHYLAVTKDKRQVSAYLDGRRIAEKLLGADPVASEYPLTIGDWFDRGRPFNGAIQEVRITRTAAPAETIADRAGALRRASAQ